MKAMRWTATDDDNMLRMRAAEHEFHALMRPDLVGAGLAIEASWLACMGQPIAAGLLAYDGRTSGHVLTDAGWRHLRPDEAEKAQAALRRYALPQPHQRRLARRWASYRAQ